jgi:putative glycosyltransferase (TIGR04348 family)
MGRFPHVRAIIVTPAPPGATTGNRVTALRWAKRLRELGWRVALASDWRDEPTDLLVALHAKRSHAAIARIARDAPAIPRIVALTGTDLYGALDDADVRASLALATRVVALQPRARELVSQARAIVQSAAAARPLAQPPFTACVLAHLRDIKDPLLAARAVGAAPGVRVIHLGDADAAWAARARDAERATGGRWSWLGARRRQDALAILAGSHAALVTSISEGGANVVSEAIAAGVPVLSTRIAGSLGVLGDDYPGLFDVGDAAALGALLARCARDAAFVGELRARVVALQPLVDPARERASWRELLAELID